MHELLVSYCNSGGCGDHSALHPAQGEDRGRDRGARRGRVRAAPRDRALRRGGHLLLRHPLQPRRSDPLRVRAQALQFQRVRAPLHRDLRGALDRLFARLPLGQGQGEHLLLLHALDARRLRGHRARGQSPHSPHVLGDAHRHSLLPDEHGGQGAREVAPRRRSRSWA